jgi:hypothetical protein
LGVLVDAGAGLAASGATNTDSVYYEGIVLTVETIEIGITQETIHRALQTE